MTYHDRRIRDFLFCVSCQAYESRRALLLIDGIDEGGEVKSRIEDFITSFLVRQRISLVVTTRPEGYTKSKYANNFARMSLAPLDRKQQEQVIENRVGRQALDGLGSQLDTMKDSEDKSICSNPLMLSMVISLYKSGSGSLPSSRFELYDKAVNTMLMRFDVKNLDEVRAQPFDRDAVERLLAKLALHRHPTRDKDISSETVEEVVRDDKSLRLAWQHIEAQVVVGRFSILSCLDPSPLKLRFAHLSFQEFLVAKDWVRHHDEDKTRPFRLAGSSLPLPVLLNDGWWHNTMRMACEKGEGVIDAMMRPYRHKGKVK